uniref:Uncharacterized protein n=1 Tax=Romanomermis culicivorax TaxID=13658 RepID=A0A915KPJ0_ROMCU
MRQLKEKQSENVGAKMEKKNHSDQSCRDQAEVSSSTIIGVNNNGRSAATSADYLADI